MNEFVNSSIRQNALSTNDCVFPLKRAQKFKAALTRVFSHHLGCLDSGERFETKGILVTGQSGSGKTKEIAEILKRFNAGQTPLPTGRHARIAECILAGSQGWKDLGRNTIRAIGYPLHEKARLTQAEIWERVVIEAKLAGVVGIHYDEAQHIFRKKNDDDCLAILDSFKTLMKDYEWPLMLIFSGVPELDGYLKREPQLDGKLDRIVFGDISLPEDYVKVHEIVGSYGLRANLSVDPELLTEEFLSKSHFVRAWTDKTFANPAATPFTHSNFETMYRKDHPFVEFLTG